MRNKVLSAVFVFALSIVCMAAERPPEPALGISEFPRLEVFGGYSYLRLGNGGAGNSAMSTNGWDATVTYNLNRYLGVSAAFEGQYAGDFFGSNNLVSGPGINHDTHVQNFLFGPTVTYRNRHKITPFAHVLLGDSRISSEPTVIAGGITYYTNSRTSWDAFAIAIGGGADLAVNRWISLRLGQFEYMRTSLNYNDWLSSYGATVNGLPTSQNHFGYSGGIVIKLR